MNTARLAHACDAAGLELVVGTIDELPWMRALLALEWTGFAPTTRSCSMSSD